MEERITGNNDAFNILYVEDVYDCFYVVKLILRRHYEVIHARSVDEAIQIIKSKKINLVLLDISLKDKFDGLELVRYLKKEGKDLPVVALTAYALQGDRQRIISSGVSGYLIKPVSRDKLFHEVEQHLA